MGCGRFVRAGETLCRGHGAAGNEGGREPATGVAAAGQPRRLAAVVVRRTADGEADGEEAGERRRRAGEAFRRRVEAGDSRGLFDRRLGEVIAQAAAERSLADEIGALRYVLARLLAEEEDPAKLAASVARVAGVAVQAARAQRAVTGDLADGLTAALTQILTELDG